MNKNQTRVQCAGILQEILLASQDATRCYGSLSKLAHHLEEPVVVTGSIATSWHLLKNNRRTEKRNLNDIDLVVEDLPSLRPSLGKDFLIRHFHPYRGGGRILIQLVDEEYGTRIDIFTPHTRTLTERLTYFAVGDLSCRVISAEDLSAKLLSVIYPATEGQPVEPKYVEDFRLLSTVADLDTVREVWREYRKESQPLDFEEAAEAVKLCVTTNPDLLREGHYSRDINQACSWCCESELFPRAPQSKIYEILGYV